MLRKNLQNQNLVLSRHNDSRIDWRIIFIVIIFMIISFFSLYFALRADESNSIIRTLFTQALWWIFGWLVAILLMHLDSDQLNRITPTVYWLGIILLILVLIGYSRSLASTNQAKSWFSFGSITFQPSEFMKPAFILMLARIVYKHNKKYPEHSVKGDFTLIGKMLLCFFPVLLLILMQPDFGSSLVFLAIFVGIFLVSGILNRILVPLVLFFVSLFSLMLFSVTTSVGRNILIHLGFKAYQFSRIDVWLHPASNKGNADAYQLYQSIKAIGSGKLTGSGFTNFPVNVPVRESDMIFSIIGEGAGFIGGILLIILYFFLIYSLIKRVFETKNAFYAYVISGVVFMILFHVFENVGMTMGLVPLTGIPLPFISQGGSALIANMIGIGLALSMQYHNFKSDFSQRGNNFR